MNLKNALADPSFEMIKIVPQSKKQEVVEELDSILKKDYSNLKKNKIYLDNFLDLVSYIYTYEQLRNGNSLKVSVFDEAFKKKLGTLLNEYEQTISLSQ